MIGRNKRIRYVHIKDVAFVNDVSEKQVDPIRFNILDQLSIPYNDLRYCDATSDWL